MNTVAIVTVPLSDVLEAMGFADKKLEKVTGKFNDYLDNEGSLPDEDLDGIVSYIDDENLLSEALKEAGIDSTAFNTIIESISKENNDLPVYVSL